MALYVQEAKNLSAMSLTDISAASDMFLLELFRELFDLPHLRNVNADKPNFPGIDLGDEVAGRAFQITADPSLAKVLSTLQTSIKHGVHETYPHIQVYVVTEKQGSYKQSSIKAVTGKVLKFDGRKDVLDCRDVLKAFKLLELDKAEKVAAVIRKHTTFKGAVSSPEDVEALERDIQNRFQEAIDRSPFPEIHSQDLLTALAEQLLAESNGKVSKELRRKVLIRAARSAASCRTNAVFPEPGGPANNTTPSSGIASRSESRSQNGIGGAVTCDNPPTGVSADNRAANSRATSAAHSGSSRAHSTNSSRAAVTSEGRPPGTRWRMTRHSRSTPARPADAALAVTVLATSPITSLNTASSTIRSSPDRQLAHKATVMSKWSISQTATGSRTWSGWWWSRRIVAARGRLIVVGRDNDGQ